QNQLARLAGIKGPDDALGGPRSTETERLVGEIQVGEPGNQPPAESRVAAHRAAPAIQGGGGQQNHDQLGQQHRKDRQTMEGQAVRRAGVHLALFLWVGTLNQQLGILCADKMRAEYRGGSPPVQLAGGEFRPCATCANVSEYQRMCASTPCSSSSEP